jgi:glycosyltransferase involved in cell wall biosynthesis
MRTATIAVVESYRWVQADRIRFLNKNLSRNFCLIITPRVFKVLFPFFRLIQINIFFVNWRILFHLAYKDKLKFTSSDFERFFVAVTSHSNLGGILAVDARNFCNLPKQSEIERALYLLSRCVRVGANSQILKNLVLAYQKDATVFLLENGVDSNFFSPDSRQTRFLGKRIRVGCVGKNRLAKNWVEIEQFESLIVKKNLPIDCRFILVEKGATDVLDREQMKSFYMNIDFYLCLSTDEGTPNPALEAASCGVPIITTMVGNMPQLLVEGRTGFFVSPTAADAVRVFEQNVLTGDFDYGRASKELRNEVVTNWDWDRKLDAYETFLTIE